MSQQVQIYKRLVEAARAAIANSYAPYSKYRVGAAVLSKDGRVFSGCNVEIVSFGGTICAERTALGSAIAAGCREFEAVAVVSEQTPEIWPCGMCRQSIAEFGTDIVVVVPTAAGGIRSLTMTELLPFYFPPAELKDKKL